MGAEAAAPTGLPPDRRRGQYNRRRRRAAAHGGGSRPGIAQDPARPAALAGRQRGGRRHARLPLALAGHRRHVARRPVHDLHDDHHHRVRRGEAARRAGPRLHHGDRGGRDRRLLLHVQRRARPAGGDGHGRSPREAQDGAAHRGARRARDRGGARPGGPAGRDGAGRGRDAVRGPRPRSWRRRGSRRTAAISTWRAMPRRTRFSSGPASAGPGASSRPRPTTPPTCTSCCRRGCSTPPCASSRARPTRPACRSSSGPGPTGPSAPTRSAGIAWRT